MGLLDGYPSPMAAILSTADSVKRRVRGLLGDPIGTAQQGVGAINDRAKEFNALSTASAMGDKVAKQQLQQKMFELALDTNPAAIGKIVYHGSPYKFDKFDTSKIGTGEGAQAYGHGLYFAESPAVAQEYAGALSSAKATKPIGNVDLTEAYQFLPEFPETLLAARRDFRELEGMGALSRADRRDFLQAVNDNLSAAKGGQMYKADIPDEAVSRFLDWDKPLSQQSPEVQSAIRKQMPESSWDAMKDRRGQDYVEHYWNSGIGGSGQSRYASGAMEKLGIPGIRYLDSGSRSAGQGTSNFVVFDPAMIRILERNEQATGAQPWGKGEWQGLLGD